VIEKITQPVLENTERTQIMLVPSLKDAAHDDVFPQPPLPAIDNERVWCFANPSTIMLQEITIAITTTDILFDMSKTGATAFG